MQTTDTLLIHRLADRSAFVIFNRLNWRTYIIGFNQIIENLNAGVIKSISSEEFIALTAKEQIETLFKADYWDTFK
ncbi:MAG: hypothetical protein ACI9IT_001848 [Glaciecola sp.]|jgi:hypothetical protein